MANVWASELADQWEDFVIARRTKQKGLDVENVYTFAVLNDEGELVEHAIKTSDLERAVALLRLLD